MTTDKKDLILKYLQEQIAQADFRARAYVYDEQNNKNPKRNCYVKLNKYYNDFLEGNTEIRWLAISGFRGVGKTTLLSQLFYEAIQPAVNKLFLSVDQITQIIDISLNDVLSVYEEILGSVFERLEKPVILFLDEVQYDNNWAITLKTIFDRSRKVFIFATGSSAVTLQTNPDVARRVIFEKLYPMSFTEYIKIKDNKFEILENEVRQYWTGIERLEVDRYMKYGTLPFAVKLKNEGLVYDQIKKILDRVVSMDIAQLGQFRNEIISKIPEILYMVAATDILSVTNLAKDLDIDRLTLTQVLNVLEKTETVLRVYPYGAHATQVRKPSKYLFASPAFRSMYYNFVGNIIGQDTYMGKLLEDTVGLYLTRCLVNKNASLTYDSTAGGADFIIRLYEQNIIVEVGYGEKGFTQINNTTKHVKSKYGLVVSSSPLLINESKTAVNIPLSHFLLL